MSSLLRPHQYDAVAALLPVLEKYHGAYLAHGTGSGKTLTAIAIAKMLKVQRILVVVGPVAALGVWRLELAKWWPQTNTWFVGDAVDWVTSYENFVKAGPFDADVRIINVDKLSPEVIKDLVKWKSELLILDEAHYCKTPTAQRTRSLWKLRNAATYFLALSGTPAHNILDYWAQYKMIDPENPLWDQTYGAYKNQVADFKGPNLNWFDGAKPGAQEMVAAQVAPVTHWFDTRDLKLPAPIYTEIPVILYEEEQRAYDQMDKDFRAELIVGQYTSASTVLVKAMRLHQLACGHATLADGRDVFRPDSSKLQTLLEILKDRTHQKVIVVARFTSEVDRIMQEATKLWPGSEKIHFVKGMTLYNDNVQFIDGRRGPMERDQIIARFQDSVEPQCLVIQPKSGGISATLTAADAMIFYSLEPSSIVWRQTIGRVFRIGTKTHVQIVSLLGEHTVDERLYNGLRRGYAENDLAKYLEGEAP